MRFRNIISAVLIGILCLSAGAVLADEEQDYQFALQKMAQAREELSSERYEVAAQKFAEAYEMMKTRQEAGNALYWEAFARYRLDSTRQLKRALELLELQQFKYEEAVSAEDGEALRSRIYAVLARRGGSDAAREVIKISDDERQREETRIHALHALLQLDPERALPVIEGIVRGDKPASPEFRRNAIFILCQIEDPRGEELLIELVHNTDDPQLLSEVIMCLSMKDSDRALDAVVDIFEKTDDRQVSEAALMALGQSRGDRAFELLVDVVSDTSADIDTRQMALMALGRTGRDEVVAPLMVSILREEDSPGMHEVALMTLSQLEGQVPDDVFLDLINNSAAGDELRAQALFFAAQRDALDVATLRKVYDQAEGRELKIQVCHVLTQMDDDDAALDLLLEIARTEKDPEVRQNAVFWVGQFDSELAADFLIEIINQD